ncbi:hypothetical protein [Brevundimonas sp.]|uniref:hypothetical protein n=1 Tax=Brevundimonas sp. TaxID=1871086 RepID=UPI002617DBD5|nr:hypothetical protein [Brevundimonas sp.]
MRRRRTASMLAAGVLAALWSISAPPTIARAGPSEGPATLADCNYVKDAKYWLCKALEASDCNLAERSNYWLCRGLAERNCALTERSDYWFCRGITEANCSLVERTNYWFCRGLTENCDLAGSDQRPECEAFSPFFRRSAR